ncbi:MAG: bifunctional 5,10-methylenetetrahydrofolate dehydrogenase/5,10-methenyltetrahydrofolate cyclohydrolase [Candidatus Saccharimonadales bacterium]
MKELNGSELAGFIKERQAKAVRGLRQAYNFQPKLAIVVTVEKPVIEIYMRLKKRYGADILIDVDIHRVEQSEALAAIKKLNQDAATHGIIVQLPLEDPSQTDEIVNAVAPEKDVDALGQEAMFDPATPTAILWLLAGYGVELRGRKITIVGRGKLVGEPLERMLRASQIDATAYNESDTIEAAVSSSDIIITATGSPGVITSEMIPLNAVVVDAGVAVEAGKAVGDLAEDVYERDDLKITPKKGGVGPLTVCALFENVIKAAKISAGIDLRA